jgi:hypothetical protein
MEALKTVGLAFGIFSCIMGGIGIITAKDDNAKIHNHLAILGGFIAVSTTLSSCKCTCSS